MPPWSQKKRMPPRAEKEAQARTQWEARMPANPDELILCELKKGENRALDAYTYCLQATTWVCSLLCRLEMGVRARWAGHQRRCVARDTSLSHRSSGLGVYLCSR